MVELTLEIPPVDTLELLEVSRARPMVRTSDSIPPRIVRLTSNTAGPHDSNVANKMDPRVDSDLDGRGNRHGAATGASAGIMGASGSHATAGSGTAQNTDGPHNSDMANKMDPRVDSDRDGSKTLGGNRTHA